MSDPGTLERHLDTLDALAAKVEWLIERVGVLERCLAAHHALADFPGPRLGHGDCPVCAAAEREAP